MANMTEYRECRIVLYDLDPHRKTEIEEFFVDSMPKP